MLRFVLSPFRELHIVDLRIALINTLVAKQRGEGTILHFNDMDKTHRHAYRDQEIRELLKKFAVDPERVLYRSEHLHRYQQLAVKLVEERKAFLCTCRSESGEEAPRCSGRCASLSTEEIRQIQEEKLPYTIRIHKPTEALTFSDRIRGQIRVEPSEVDHFVLLHSDASPSDDFACACDDMLGNISLVIQEDRPIHAARQIYIRRALGYDLEIETAGLPPLLDSEGKKLSPTDEKSAVRTLLEEGFLPDAIINELLLPGMPDSQEIFTLPEARNSFELSHIPVEGVRFDLQRLRRINRAHLLRMDDLALSRIFRFADADIGRLAKLYLRDGAATITELEAKISALFAPKKCGSEEAETMHALSTLIAEAPLDARFDEWVKYLLRKSGIEEDRLLPLLRRLITGSDEGPALEEIYSTIKAYLPEVARCQP